MHTIILYHDDLDGETSAAIASVFLHKLGMVNQFGDIDKYPLDYNKNTPNEFLKKYLDICDKPANEVRLLILDYSFSTGFMFLKAITDLFKEVIWIDHHKTSYEFAIDNRDQLDLIENLGYFIRDIKTVSPKTNSGAYMTYCYFEELSRWEQPTKMIFNPGTRTVPLVNKPSHLVDIVTVWDAHITLYPPMFDDAYCFKLCMDSKSREERSILLNTMFMNGLRDERDTVLLDEMVENGRPIRNYLIKSNEKIRGTHQYLGLLDGVKCAVINRLSSSDIFADVYTKIPLVVVFAQLSNRKWKYTLYSHKSSKVDCSEIAKTYGGGGHKGAAGFIVDDPIVFDKLPDDTE